MAWTIKISNTARKQFKKLDQITQKRIINFLHSKLESCENPRTYGKALQGAKKQLWRYRIGSYRLICDIDDQTITITVLALGHRRSIYREI